MRIKQALAATHVGKKMSRNEDGVLQIPDVPLYAIVDGTGGTEPAEVALDTLRAHTRELIARMTEVNREPKTSSRLAVGRFFEEVFEEAGREIRDTGARLGNAQLGAAMIAATVVERFAYVAHVGDTRAYLLRGEELWILTTDHTVAMAQLARGDITPAEYEDSPFKKTLTQALGTSAKLDVAFAEVWLAPGDVLLLCSDGLTRVVPDDVICQTLHGRTLPDAAKLLVKQAVKAGGPDNVSVILLEIERDESSVTSTTDIAETLRDVFLFRELSEPDRMIIAPYLEEVFFDPGQVILREGELGESFYVVISGEVRVSSGAVHLTDIGPGGNFGELALVGSGRRTATVTALTRTRLFELSHERFMQLIRSKPTMAARLLMPLLVRVSSRLADLTERVARGQGGA